MFGLGGTEIIIILVIGLVLFGAKRLPELGKGLGTGIREFKKGEQASRFVSFFRWVDWKEQLVSYRRCAFS